MCNILNCHPSNKLLRLYLNYRQKGMICEPAQIYEDILIGPQCNQNFNNELNAVSLAFNIS